MLQIWIVEAVVIGNVVRMPFFVKPRLAMFSRCTGEHFDKFADWPMDLP